MENRINDGKQDKVTFSNTKEPCSMQCDTRITHEGDPKEVRGLVATEYYRFSPIDDFCMSPLIVHKEKTESAQKWQEMLTKENIFSYDVEVDIYALFRLIKETFEKVYGCELDVSFSSMYIVSRDGKSTVKHDFTPRSFTEGKVVYIDRLIVNVLFEYIANNYIWSRYGQEVFGFCFQYAINLIDICCRQGFINSDENVASLLEFMKDKCDARALVFVADMYWSILAFIMCHEVAHIYIAQVLMKQSEWKSGRNQEALADEIGYEVYLHIIDGKASGAKSAFTEVFHDYLYAAPMVLFLFYEDLYFMQKWIYGESISLKEHPQFEERINSLLEISRRPDFDFDIHQGDDVLNCFWDISEYFREELFYKLKNGKLSSFKQKGYVNMNNPSGSESALAFDNRMKEMLVAVAKEQHIDQNKLIGLYNMTSDYVILGGDVADHSFIRIGNEKSTTTKAWNLRFRLCDGLAAIVDMGLTLFSEDEDWKTVIQLLKILLQLFGQSTIELSEEQAKVLIKCYEMKAHCVPVEEERILSSANASHKTIDELCKLRCIELDNGLVTLIEEINII